jgi:hypothetical protein
MVFGTYNTDLPEGVTKNEKLFDTLNETYYRYKG